MDRARIKTLYAEFLSQSLSLLIADRTGALHRASGHGLQPLMDHLTEDPSSLHGALVFDKIVGTAAALLLVFGQVSELWTPVASVSALSVLVHHRVHFRVEELIPYVPNVAGTGPCPFEVMAAQKTPEQLYTHLSSGAAHHRHTS